LHSFTGVTTTPFHPQPSPSPGVEWPTAAQHKGTSNTMSTKPSATATTIVSPPSMHRELSEPLRPVDRTESDMESSPISPQPHASQLGVIMESDAHHTTNSNATNTTVTTTGAPFVRSPSLGRNEHRDSNSNGDRASGATAVTSNQHRAATSASRNGGSGGGGTGSTTAAAAAAVEKKDSQQQQWHEENVSMLPGAPDPSE